LSLAGEQQLEDKEAASLSAEHHHVLLPPSLQQSQQQQQQQQHLPGGFVTQGAGAEAAGPHEVQHAEGASAPWEARVQELLFSERKCSRSSRLPALPVLEDLDDSEEGQKELC